MEAGVSGARDASPPPQQLRPSILGRVWQNYAGGPDGSVADVDTGVDSARLTTLLEALCRVPEGFKPHPKVKRLLEQRRRTGSQLS